MRERTDDAWFTNWRNAADQVGQITLVCLPHAGAGASVYARWAEFRDWAATASSTDVSAIAADDLGPVTPRPPQIFAVGLVAAFVSAFIAVRGLLRYISRHDFTAFAYYRIVFGVLVLVLAHSGLVAWN